MQREPRSCLYTLTHRIQLFNSVHRLQEVKPNIFFIRKNITYLQCCPIYWCFIGCHKYDTYNVHCIVYIYVMDVCAPFTLDPFICKNPLYVHVLAYIKCIHFALLALHHERDVNVKYGTCAVFLYIWCIILQCNGRMHAICCPVICTNHTGLPLEIETACLGRLQIYCIKPQAELDRQCRWGRLLIQFVVYHNA